ncbi:hypothetical protein BDN70DRAFT_880824 [Pholiota conissans]|uniref:Uncharacterized protein n=1 Tax=Pholiota conissans TaxID=109636 RepID=A0A9P5YYB0_9AGAR|nr:hypothetical protein BDN70DRAFT_880824 [Pholiota conissans]
MSRRGPFQIHTSHIIRTPCLSKVSSAKRTKNPFVRDVRLRISAERYRAEMRIAMAKETRKSLEAEEQGAQNSIVESNLILRIVDGSTSSLDPSTALRLARAVRDTLVSEENVAKLKLEEAQLLLQNLHDAVEEAHARVNEANDQVGALLHYFDSNGIRIPKDEDDALQITNIGPDALTAANLKRLPTFNLGGDSEVFSDVGDEDMDFGYGYCSAVSD